MLTEPHPLSPELEVLLTRAMFPDPARIRHTLERYRTDPGQRVFAWRVDGQSVSAAGVQPRGAEVELLHLATAPGQERQGYARALLHALADDLNAARLLAETDEDAVGFYRHAGFEVRPTVPRGGRTRYLCTLTRP